MRTQREVDNCPSADADHRAQARRASRSARRWAGLLALANLAILVLADTAEAAADRSRSPVYAIPEVFGGPRSPVGTSTLIRSDRGVSVRVHTSGLRPGDVVTSYWVVFNNPDKCEHGIPRVSRCGPADGPTNPAAQGSVLLGPGRIVSKDGTAVYGARLRVGDTSRALDGGPGLLDAHRAEVILVLKTHGPKIRGLTAEMLRTLAGGCRNQDDAPPGAPPELVGTPGPNACRPVQVTVHTP